MMTLISLVLVLLGIYGLLTQRHIIKMLVAINIMEIGINLFIISVGYVPEGVAPILSKWATNSNLVFVDPLPQALVLTAIVIGVGTTALGLVIARKIYETYGTYELDQMKGCEDE